MKRPTKGYSGQEVALFPTMLDITEPSTSPSRITSSPSPSPEPSPSHSPEHSPTHSPSPAPSPTPEHITAAPTQPSPGAEHHLPTPNESPIHVVHSHGSDEGRLKLNELTDLVTKLFDRIGVLEDDLKTTKQTYNSAFTKLNASNETEPVIQDVTPIEVIQDQESSEKGSAKVSTAGAKKGTASKEVPIVSTAEVNLSTAGGTVTYSRRSEEQRKRKDKGKAIMIESEPKKKSKREIEQERLSFAEAIRLEEQMNKEQRAQIARDEEIARQWDEEERQRAMAEAKSTKKIDWNDPSVIRKSILEKRHMERQKMGSVREELQGFLDIIPRVETDVEELYRLVKERYSASRPEGYDLMLWGDLHTLFEPGEDGKGDEYMKSPTHRKKDFSYNKILKDLKKEFYCNGTFVQDSELGQFQNTKSGSVMDLKKKNRDSYVIGAVVGIGDVVSVNSVGMKYA
ncbi:hypothetical protein Tco_0353097 [Tanacetum coccineum]